MTDSEIAELRKGDRLQDETGRVFTVQGNARPESPQTTAAEVYQAILVSKSGNLVIRLTYRDTGIWSKVP